MSEENHKVAEKVTIRRERSDLIGKLFKATPFPIYLLENGKFAAQRGEEWVIAGTLRGLEKICAERRKAVKLFSFQLGDPEPKVIDAAELRGNKVVARDGGRVYWPWSDMFPYDAKVIKELQAVSDEYNKILDARKQEDEKFEKRWDKITDRLERVSKYDLNELVAEKGV